MLHLSRRSLIRSPNCDAGTPNKKSGVEIERTAENRTRRLDTPIVTNAEVDRRIAEALEAERKVAIPALRETIDELLEQERERAKSHMTESMRSLELQVARLQNALSALQWL